MSETTPPGPRHARFDQYARADEPVRSEESEPPTTTIPTLIPGEFTDDTTHLIPVIPAQRGAPASVPAPRRPDPWYEDRPVAHESPAGLHPVATVPKAPRRRVLPAVLAGVTVCLLAAGIAVGVGGAAGTDFNGQPTSVSGSP